MFTRDEATIITRVSPRIQGVIGNTLRNRETGQSFNVTEESHEVIEEDTKGAHRQQRQGGRLDLRRGRLGTIVAKLTWGGST